MIPSLKSSGLQGSIKGPNEREMEPLMMPVYMRRARGGGEGEGCATYRSGISAMGQMAMLARAPKPQHYILYTTLYTVYIYMLTYIVVNHISHIVHLFRS